MDVEKLVTLLGVVKEERYKKLEEMGGVAEVCRQLHTSPTSGLLPTVDIEQRRRQYGSSKIQPKKPKTFASFVYEASSDPVHICLAVLATVQLLLSFYHPPKRESQSVSVPASETNGSFKQKSDVIEACAIYGAVLIITLVTALSDWEKQKQFEGLKSKVADRHEVSVIRDGKNKRLPAYEVVVGDVCQIKYGDSLPADGIVLQCHDLKVDEASITGESKAAEKTVTEDCFLYSGTAVMEGGGKMLVAAVGVNSQTGKIMKLLGATGDQHEGEAAADKKRKDRSILQNKLSKMALQVANMGFFTATLAVLELIARYAVVHYGLMGQSPHQQDIEFLISYITIGVTIVVVALPSGLPLAVTLALAYSVKQMMNENNLVRHLYACETMGNATTICSDKTGTLTENRMTVVTNYLFGQQNISIKQLQPAQLQLLCQSIAINTSYTSQVHEDVVDVGGSAHHKLNAVGNSTECALLALLMLNQIHYTNYRTDHPEESFVKVYTFNSSRKCMATVIRVHNENDEPCLRVLCKGASEILLKKCTYIMHHNEVVALNSAERDELTRDIIERMASDGLRTLCMAYRDFPDSEGGMPNWEAEDSVMSKMTCIGIVGIEDPVREGVPEAIKQCQRAGIVVRMVTGDNLLTAKSIAKHCGIIKGNVEGAIMTGVQFNKSISTPSGEYSQELFHQVWPKLRVLARAQPTDKYVLVKGIIDSRCGQVVAVTGDGTNDAPALKKADVGFAMGITGTDVAKEASDIILTDDNFTSIVKAVMWGRNVYDSIAKYIQFQLTVNVVAVFVAFVGSCVIQDSPLRTVQMLWVNLIMDTGASLALATEKPTLTQLNRKPYGRWKALVSPIMAKNVFCQSLFQIVIVMTILFHGDTIFDVDTGRYSEAHAPPSKHFTLVFNVFVLMTLCNEINARTVNGERNVFKGLFRNKVYLSILGGSLILQIIIVELGGVAFGTTPLGLELWLWSIFLGLSSLVWGQVVACIPNVFIHSLFRLVRGKPKTGVKGQKLSARTGSLSSGSATKKRRSKRRRRKPESSEDDFTPPKEPVTPSEEVQYDLTTRNTLARLNYAKKEMEGEL